MYLDLKKKGNEIGTAMAAFAAIHVLFSLLLSGAVLPEAVRTAVSGLSVIASAGVAAALLRRDPENFRESSVRPLSGRDLLLLLPLFWGTFLLYYLLGDGMDRILQMLGARRETAVSLPQDPMGLVLFFLCVAVIPAVMEELLFRGTLYRMLLPAGEGFSLAVTGLLFALSHWQIEKFLPVFFFSAVLCLSYMESGNLLMPMLLHLLNNLTGIAGMLLKQRFGDRVSGIYTGALLGLGAASLLTALCFFRGRRDRYLAEELRPCRRSDLLQAPGLWIAAAVYLLLIAAQTAVLF